VAGKFLQGAVLFLRGGTSFFREAVLFFRVGVREKNRNTIVTPSLPWGKQIDTSGP
jgi:hypothetical protein